MKPGDLIHDFALGRYGIIVSGAWVERRDPGPTPPINWEWLVLYDDGLQGADTNDLKVIDDRLRNYP